MGESKRKVIQYLNEAYATEMGLVRVLRSQVAMAPRGSYRRLLENHLDETRRHAERVRSRIDQLDGGANPLQAGIGAVETVLAQALALWKAPLDIIRGTGGEEKVLKNAKDACATEALEIATYLALERLATAVGDDATARLAASIRNEEERMLEGLEREIPKLAEAVARAEVEGDRSYDVTEIGVADAARRHGREALDEATSRLGGEPWSGYDEQTADEIRAALAGADERRARQVRDYERAHKKRATVLQATERELAGA